MSRHAQQPEPTGADLVVLSHLRWAFVWQRPLHLITRITAAERGTADVPGSWRSPGRSRTSTAPASASRSTGT